MFPEVSFEPYEGHEVDTTGFIFELPIEFGGSLQTKEANKDHGVMSFDIKTSA